MKKNWSWNSNGMQPTDGLLRKCSLAHLLLGSPFTAFLRFISAYRAFRSKMKIFFSFTFVCWRSKQRSSERARDRKHKVDFLWSIGVLLQEQHRTHFSPTSKRTHKTCSFIDCIQSIIIECGVHTSAHSLNSNRSIVIIGKSTARPM